VNVEYRKKDCHPRRDCLEDFRFERFIDADNSPVSRGDNDPAIGRRIPIRIAEEIEGAENQPCPNYVQPTVDPDADCDQNEEY